MKNFMSTVVVVFCGIISIYGQTVPSYVPTTGLVGWWPFNGNAIDESINTNDGTVSGATLTTDRFGIINSAFSTSAGYISCGNLSVPTNSTLTVSFWYKSLSNFGIKEVICIGSLANTTWGCVIGDNSFTLNYGRGCGSTGSSLANIPLLYANWHHIVYVSGGLNNTTKIYHDGDFVSTTINANSSGACSISQLFFGTDIYSGIELFNGSLDDIGIWNRALTSCEVKKLYNLNSGETLSSSSNTICLGESVFLNASGATNYLWSNGAISSSIIVTPTVTTVYSVTTTYSIGCSETQTISINVNPCTGIDELENNQSIVFYPNPFTNEIYVKVEGDIKNKKYLIYTASGQFIQSGILNGNKINCSDFSKGLYFIKLEGSAKAFRLVKEN